MKKLIGLSLSLFLFIQANGQFELNLKGENIKSGEKVELLEIVVNTQGLSYARMKIGEETITHNQVNKFLHLAY